MVLLNGCAPWNAQTRAVPSQQPTAPGDSAYIESHRSDGRNYGCSFIEFDGRGGFIRYNQLLNALKVLDERKQRSSVLLVIYCHGWNNNSESGDVLRFMGFLQRLSDSDAIRAEGLRVEGAYLAWRGSQYLPAVSSTDEMADPKLREDFGGDLIDHKWNDSAIGDTVLAPARYLSYWSIKDRAEFYASRVPLARAVFRLAFDLKSPTELQKNRRHRVFVIGHSFGALLLEQAIGQASVGLIASDWNRKQTRDARWPFDLIVFLNSAAPSLYAKQLREFLEDDQRTSARPKIISITSTGDWATGIMHPLGNWSKRFSPDLQHPYYPYGVKGPTVPAWQYYDLTPGHNQYLIGYGICADGKAQPAGALNSADKVFSLNLRRDNPEDMFYTQLPDGTIQAWKFGYSDPRKSGKPLKQNESTYWIATVPPQIIQGHTGIWTGPAMEMLAGVYRISEQLSTQPAAPKPVATPAD